MDDYRQAEELRKKNERWRDLGEKFSGQKLVGEYRSYGTFSSVSDINKYLWKKATAAFPPLLEGYCPPTVDFLITEKFIHAVFKSNPRLFLRFMKKDDMETWTLINLERAINLMGNDVKLVLDSKVKRFHKFVRYKGQLFEDAINQLQELADDISFNFEPDQTNIH